MLMPLLSCNGELSCAGPFLEHIGTVAYKLELAVTMKIHGVLHVALLKPCHRDGLVEPPPPPELMNDEPEWEVDLLVDHHLVLSC